MRMWLAAAFVPAFFMFAGTPGAAPVCGPNDAVARRLLEGYGEAPTAMGVTSAGALLQLFTSATGSFTLVLTRPDGLACLMAVGEGWQPLERPSPAMEQGPGL